MRIVFSVDWYSEGMGYAENLLPAAMARAGHDVFVVTSTMQVYGDHSFYREVYEEYLGPPFVEPGTKVLDGVTVIRLPVSLWWRRMKVARARSRTIMRLRPDIVYSWDPRSLQTVLLAGASLVSDFVLVSAVHTVGSVYPAHRGYAKMSFLQRVRLRLTDTFLGWLASRRIVLCYANAPDAAEIGTRFFGVRPETVRLVPSGIDVSHFHPCQSEEDARERMLRRAKLSVASDELLCIYTGRFTLAKNPLCLAQAVATLRARGARVRALFLGEGEQATAIAAFDGCAVQGFQSYRDLPSIYRAADIGVWPRQESISMTDAAACGLPIVASDKMSAAERIDGNGLTYSENNAANLAATLERLFDPEERRRLGERGVAKMTAQFDIDSIGRRLLVDFDAARHAKTSRAATVPA